MMMDGRMKKKRLLHFLIQRGKRRRKRDKKKNAKQNDNVWTVQKRNEKRTNRLLLRLRRTKHSFKTIRTMTEVFLALKQPNVIPNTRISKFRRIDIGRCVSLWICEFEALKNAMALVEVQNARLGKKLKISKVAHSI
jgi:hypothetical protein